MTREQIGAKEPTARGFESVEIEILLNDRSVQVGFGVHETLAEVLRERLGLTGTKISCDEQVCGSCTVLMDNLPVSACTTLAYEARHRTVTTIEGLADPDPECALHPLQQAFIDSYALQCGFCTPGMIMAALGLLITEPAAGEERVMEYMDGNLCRCTGYKSIVDAVVLGGRRMKGNG